MALVATAACDQRENFIDELGRAIRAVTAVLDADVGAYRPALCDALAYLAEIRQVAATDASNKIDETVRAQRVAA